jgi:hypothetical protein
VPNFSSPGTRLDRQIGVITEGYDLFPSEKKVWAEPDQKDTKTNIKQRKAGGIGPFQLFLALFRSVLVGLSGENNR